MPSIKISNSDNSQFVWQKPLTNEEMVQLKKDCLNTRSMISPICASLYPVRTNNLSNILKDTFFPTLVNHAKKVEAATQKIFAILGAVILDLLTFPIRLITFIPRAIMNLNTEQHPILKFMQESNCPPEVSASDFVIVEFSEQRGHEELQTFSYNVNLIDLPEDRMEIRMSMTGVM